MKPHEGTAGITDEALGPPAGLLPQDEKPGRCFYCGLEGEYPVLIRTVLPVGEVARRCRDSVDCIKRRRRD